MAQSQQRGIHLTSIAIGGMLYVGHEEYSTNR